jgi:uncharacterized protein YbjT (DUF2867 family)
MVVITGATGNIGSKITSLLLSRGQRVRCIARTADRLGQFTGRGAEAAPGSLEDTAFLTRAFSGAEAVFTMIPPSYAAADFRAYQNRVGASIAGAIENSGVRHVVNLSSQGAHLPEGTGPVKGLHDQEARLNGLKGVNVLHMRPTYFMENLLAYAGMIRNNNVIGSAIMGDLKFAMIATKDIAQFAAERLAARDFPDNSVRDLLGQRDISMNEATGIIAEKVNRPGLRYVQLSYEDVEKNLLGAGFSEDVGRQFTEMIRALNGGLFSNIPRDRDNTTGTSFEEFAEVFSRLLAS